jgi:amino acid transporter
VAREGKAPSFMKSLNQSGAPWLALIAQALWTILLLLLPGSNFSTLLDYFGPASWMFYGLSASCVIRYVCMFVCMFVSVFMYV